MDRNLIASYSDHHWLAHNILNPRRYNSEKKLIKRLEKSLLVPQDEAFHPAAEGLKWRSIRLIA